MKINEIIFESDLQTSRGYKKHIKNIENELKDGLAGVIRVPKLLPLIFQDYSSEKISPPEALQLFKTIKAIYEDLLYDDDVWKELSRHDPSGKIAKQISTRIIQEENYIDDYIKIIKQDHGLSEDIVDFKGPNGQLSAMSTKRPKTKKDTARSEVEQLFKENKK
jgi:hypothetical protein